MNKNYIVSWFDSEGNEWFSDWCKFAEAKKLFDALSAKNIIEIALYCHDNAIRECGFHFA